MTKNDIVITEQLVNIPMRSSMCSAEVRRGDLDAALKHAEAVIRHGVALRLQLQNLGAKCPTETS